MSFKDAYEKLMETTSRFKANKVKMHKSGKLKDTDYFPCWYCENHYKKVDWLKRHPNNSWTEHIREQ